MTRINPKTPLSDLINARLSELSISRTDLVRRLGYANQARGLRRFDEFIATGQITTHLLKGLPDVLGLDAVDVEGAATATRQPSLCSMAVIRLYPYRPNRSAR